MFEPFKGKLSISVSEYNSTAKGWLGGTLTCWGLVLLLGLTGPLARASENPTFESDVVPLLQARCWQYHGESSRQADLDLRTLDAILKGGKSGPALMPGSAERSLLLEKTVSGAMPPGDQTLTPKELQLLRMWIEQGARRDGDPALPVRLTEKNVTPIFLRDCVVCHGKRKQEGGLDLRTLASLRKGGQSGPALIPGDAAGSLLFQRIVSGEMPPPELFFEYRVRPPSNAEV